VLLHRYSKFLWYIQQPCGDRNGNHRGGTGYTQEEKVEIAKKNTSVQNNGRNMEVKATQITFEKKSFYKIIEDYTENWKSEGLERVIGKVGPNVAKSLAMEESMNENHP